ncbi:MAG: hypothetical protein WD022_01830 [Balneolaceae bacterium]
MNSLITNNKFLRYINSKIPPIYRRHYSYYEKTLDLISKAEQSGDEFIKEFQLNKINDLLNIAWQIPGYQKYWKNEDFNKKRLESLAEFTELPVLKKSYIKAHREDFKPNQPTYKTTRTGGSTGSPFQSYEPIYLPRIELAFIHSIWKRFYDNIDLNTKATILRGAKIKGKSNFDPMKGLFLSSYQLTSDSARDFIELIDKHKTPILHAYPSSLIQFVKYLKKLDKYPKHQFSLIALGSEPITKDQKKYLSDFFQAPIAHWYGQGEKVVLAGNRPDDQSLIIEKLYSITELLNTEDKAIETGKEGRIIGTSLWNTTMPLLRYDTGDRGVSGKIWESNINQPENLVAIKGRSHEFLVTKNQSLVPVTALTLSYRRFDEIKRVQFVQSMVGTASILVELMPDSENFDLTPLKELLDDLLHNQVDVDIEVVPKIKPTESGKHVYLIQNLNLSSFKSETPA